MGWIEDLGKAVEFIEKNITEQIGIKDIAESACMSPFYFQKGFAMLCGFTVGSYLRMRRLSLAGSELLNTDNRLIDIALKYGYDSPDSFTKAFIRFHGVSPAAVRKDGAMIKAFAPLKIKFSLEGGFLMNYKIEEKGAFTVSGVSKRFKYDSAKEDIPRFWSETWDSGNRKNLCGMFGICIDEGCAADEFEYIIADVYNPSGETPEGFVTRVIPQHTWAVFPCTGPMPAALQDVNERIFSEWLPNCKEYEIAAGYNVEMYTDINNYAHGNQDEKYYSEIWIPVKKRV